MSRLIVLDTETTGLDFEDGHKIIEIGCIEIVDRKITDNTFHKFINPKRAIDIKAFEVHGISNDFLKDKPLFVEIIDDFLNYVSNSAFIIHNAPFDLGFLKQEFINSNQDPDLVIGDRVIHDTLQMARKKNPGKRNSLDALCSRFDIDNTERNLHGGLLDAELLAKVYLKMTQGQTNIMGLNAVEEKLNTKNIQIIKNREERVIAANKEELQEHNNYFK